MARIPNHWEYLEEYPKMSVSARNNTNWLLTCVQAGVFSEKNPRRRRILSIPLCDVVVVASAG